MQLCERETYNRRLSCRAIAAYLLEFIYGQVSLILMRRLQNKLKLKPHLAKMCRLLLVYGLKSRNYNH